MHRGRPRARDTTRQSLHRGRARARKKAVAVLSGPSPLAAPSASPLEPRCFPAAFALPQRASTEAAALQIRGIHGLGPALVSLPGHDAHRVLPAPFRLLRRREGRSGRRRARAFGGRRARRSGATLRRGRRWSRDRGCRRASSRPRSLRIRLPLRRRAAA